MSIIKQQLVEIFDSALRAVDPCNAVKKAIRILDHKLIADRLAYELHEFRKIVVVGAGKGTAPMAQAVEDILGNRIDDGVIIVKYGHTRPLNRIREIEASHPLPDEAGVKGTEEIIEILKEVDEKTLVICLLSGGGSALLVSPAEGISLKDKQITTDLLLKSGASIDELNAVRKHLSRVKGGKLASIAYPATVISLILSDVIDDRLDVIASGPTVPDRSTFMDAVKAIEKYNLVNKLPNKVLSMLLDGTAGKLPDTPKAGEDCFKKGSTVIVGSLRQALNAASNEAEKMGFDMEFVTDKLQGEASEAAKYLADISIVVKNSMKNGRPKCLISGGETTVAVKGSGLGGRNQELALAFALEIEGKNGITMLSVGTDGTDGSTDAAGAIVDGETVVLAKKFGLDPVEYLKNNDSYNFFKKLDYHTGPRNHLVIGPTGTNVMDVQIIVVE
ncbi:MAG: glycerate kinase [Deltaproteobacteria bacterium]